VGLNPAGGMNVYRERFMCCQVQFSATGQIFV
jgi:hypothetical protein